MTYQLNDDETEQMTDLEHLFPWLDAARTIMKDGDDDEYQRGFLDALAYVTQVIDDRVAF